MTPENKTTPARAVNRYHDGYQFTGTVIALGKICKWVGIGVGVLVYASQFAMMANSFKEAAARPDSPILPLIGGIVMPLVIASFYALIGWLVGTTVSALGFMLQANLDTAVNSSPFLSEAEKVELMSLE
jgi:hypothetical protein